MSKILIIDDEPDILALVKNALRKDHHDVKTAQSAESIAYNSLTSYDLILLDVMLPELDGFTYCKKIRTLVDCPILFLTAKIMEDDIVTGLGLGADDYITKPFGTIELRARINAHLRREKREHHSTLSVSGVHFDLSAKEVSINESQIHFTKSEYLICEYLASHPGQVFSREQIYDAVYGPFFDSDPSTISEHIKNIRAKFSRYDLAPITTVWGIGYKWV